MAIVILFALLGALVVGGIAGLYYRGYVFLGNRRQLDIMTAQLDVEQQVASLTRETMRDMRRAVQEHHNITPGQ